MTSELFGKLFQLDQLSRYQIDMSDVETLERDLEFVKKLQQMMIKYPEGGLSQILDLFWSQLKVIDKSMNKEQWVKHIYHFCQFLSFPATRPEFQGISVNKKKIFFLFLLAYRQMIHSQYPYQHNSCFINQYPLTFLSGEEIKLLEKPGEYWHFINSFEQLFVYEMMSLSKEIYQYNTLDHICGVHALSLGIARQLQRQRFSLDLGIVSGSAAGHDIGKYGCRKSEEKKVPYLHYYYTDLWFQKQHIPYIGHIAVNHSVWDLELENLSLESLILIYCDFRVKNNPKSDHMNIYSLRDSFHIILNKLDNLDKQKEERYRRVFAKLKDFEDFLIEEGVNIDLVPFTDKGGHSTKKQRFFPLLSGEEIIRQIKRLSLAHSFQLMFQLRNESSINAILESARSQKSWQDLQEYLRIFSGYATYLNQNEKRLVLKFLYEQLIFPEEGVRRRSAQLIGYLIATFDEKYRKEIPDDISIEPSMVKSTDLLEKYIGLFLEPGYKASELNQNRIRENLSLMFKALFGNSQDGRLKGYLRIIKKYYEKYDHESIGKNIGIALIQALKNIPIDFLSDENIVLIDFLIRFMQHKQMSLRINALDVADNMLEKGLDEKHCRKIFQPVLSQGKVCSVIPAENYLRHKIIKKMKENHPLLEDLQQYCLQDIKEKIDQIYLNNLKSSTQAIIKKVQIDMLAERAVLNQEERLYTALHFCNILKVSSHEPIRNYAGGSLIQIIPYLNVEQRNDINIELLKALEIDDYQFTKYIPYYLGQSAPFLPPREIDEFIDELEQKIKIADQWTCTLLIRTIAVAISRYAPYKRRYPQEQNFFQKRLMRMLGILMNGLAHDDPLVKRVTSKVIGKEIFASKNLSLKEKNDIFILIAKKLLNLIAPVSQQDILLFFSNSVALHQLYVFISDYHFYEGEHGLSVPGCIAFFPGSFDPFSLSHKEIVREIQNMGMEVYLSVDEFSWSKRTQPHLYRKNIITMSIAGELNVYLYPENLPGNIANPKDLEMLKKQFPHSKIYIVAGSDVILNASAYKNTQDQHSVSHFPHIIFNRKPFRFSERKQKKYQEILDKLDAEIIQLNLQAPFEEISSSQIRKNIDHHRDISDLVDPLAERYIYQYGLYQREPQYKSILQKVSTQVEVIEDLSDYFLKHLAEEIFDKNIREKALKNLEIFRKKLNPRIILLKDTSYGGKILGFAAIHWVRSSLFYHDFKNNVISQYIRDHATGRIIIIDGIFTVTPEKNISQFKNLEQIILTEALTFCMGKDYDYAVFKNMIPQMSSYRLTDTLKLFGFSELPIKKQASSIMAVDIRKPSTISLDIETLIKEPFVKSPKVVEVIDLARKKLQKVMTQLYPGHLLIPFNIDLINQSIVSKVCHENGVSAEPENGRKLGPLMCVPFGKILHKMVVPNTVTKSLHTDKIFTPDMQHFKIDSFGYYMSLENQVKMIKSFNRPVLLVDDLLHKGYRLKALSPLLKKENIKVDKLIVGLLSGRGKELAMIQKRSVDSAYFIPNLRVWFNESDLYPFIGGDGLFRVDPEQGNLVRSINMILPFAYPLFLKGVNQKTVYELSEICIKNAIQITKALEEEYQNIYHRKLTLSHLAEVCLYPRYPDHGKNMNYGLSEATSMYLENDLELLYRIWQDGIRPKTHDALRYPYSKEFAFKKEVL